MQEHMRHKGNEGERLAELYIGGGQREGRDKTIRQVGW